MTVDQGLKPSRVEALSLRVLIHDHRVLSRPLDMGWVKQRIPRYDPNKLGVMSVSQRAHGLYAVLDGQHRYELSVRALKDWHIAPCRIYQGLTLAQEIELAQTLNAPPPPADRKPSPLERFLTRRAEGDEAAVAITRLAASLGWEISERQTTANIIAVTSLERVYQGGSPGGGVSDELTTWQTLYAVTRAWGHQRDAVNGDVLLGVGLALLRDDGPADLDALIKRLTRYRGGPRALLTNARQTRALIGGTVAEAVAYLLTP